MAADATVTIFYKTGWIAPRLVVVDTTQPGALPLKLPKASGSNAAGGDNGGAAAADQSPYEEARAKPCAPPSPRPLSPAPAPKTPVVPDVTDSSPRPAFASAPSTAGTRNPPSRCPSRRSPEASGSPFPSRRSSRRSAARRAQSMPRLGPPTPRQMQAHPSRGGCALARLPPAHPTHPRLARTFPQPR